MSSNTETVLKKYKDIRIIHSDRGSQYTLLVVEHDKDIIKIADEIIDVGPLAGKNGGTILFQGSFENLLLSNTKTGNAMKEEIGIKQNPLIQQIFYLYEMLIFII